MDQQNEVDALIQEKLRHLDEMLTRLIPGMLREAAPMAVDVKKGKAVWIGEGRLTEIIKLLREEYPEVAPLFLDRNGNLQASIHLSINGRDLSGLPAGMNTRVGYNDRVVLNGLSDEAISSLQEFVRPEELIFEVMELRELLDQNGEELRKIEEEMRHLQRMAVAL